VSDDHRGAPVPPLTHLDEAGAARMVDVAQKPVTARVALAGAILDMQPETLRRILQGGTWKGEVLQVARVAGIQGAKRTADLIPLCHPLPLTSVEVAFEVRGEGSLEVRCTARVTGRTGVEMEALVGAGIASLTLTAPGAVPVLGSGSLAGGELASGADPA